VGRCGVRSTTQRDASNVVCVNSLRDGWGLPGLGIGWTISDSELGPYIAAASEASTRCLGTTQQRVAARVLSPRHSPRIQARMRHTARKRVEHADGVLRRFGVLVGPTDKSIYLWVDIRGARMTSDEFTAGLLDKQRVRVASGTAFGSAGEGCVRLRPCLGVDLDEACTRFGRFYARLAKS
jgi:aspartate/methionine/tyrosine aminotransferase